MASLNLNNTAASLQQQRQAESRNPLYGNSAPSGEPLAAPQPTRASSGMWTPDMGIRFGAAGEASSGSGSGAKDSRWDPAKGMKFS